MTASHRAIVTPNTSTDHAPNRPAPLPRRQRVAAAIASALISAFVLGGVLCGFTGAGDAPAVIAGEAATAGRA